MGASHCACYACLGAIPEVASLTLHTIRRRRIAADRGGASGYVLVTPLGGSACTLLERETQRKALLQAIDGEFLSKSSIIKLIPTSCTALITGSSSFRIFEIVPCPILGRKPSRSESSMAQGMADACSFRPIRPPCLLISQGARLGEAQLLF